MSRMRDLAKGLRRAPFVPGGVVEFVDAAVTEIELQGVQIESLKKSVEVLAGALQDVREAHKGQGCEGCGGCGGKGGA